MADQKLTELDALTSASDDDLLYIVDDPSGSPASKKITLGDLINSPDWRPATAQDYDDEFDGIALDGKWTTILPHATLTISNGLCNIAGPSTGTDHRLQGIEQTVSGDWKVRCKVYKNMGFVYYPAFCLGVRDSSSNKVRYTAWIDHSSYGAGAFVDIWGDAGYDSFAGETNHGFNVYDLELYFEMEHASSTVYWRISRDGFNYYEIYNATDANYVTNPDRICLGIYTYNVAANYSIAWFREF